MNVLGLCLGASTLSLVELETFPDQGRPRVTRHHLHPHEGNPKRTLISALERLDLSSYDRVAVTGRKFRGFVNLSSISEPEAVEYAYRAVKPPGISCPAVIAAGGETFMVYALNPAGEITNVITGNKCASGTGEFFLQQLRRMDVSLEEAARWSSRETPHHVSGRCSVFCKSDCTHATNKGIPRSQVTAGLCRMMAHKILELLKKVERKNLMLTGGTARNRMMVAYLAQKIPGLIVPPEAPYFEALGAALWAADHDTLPAPPLEDLLKRDTKPFHTLPPLRDSRDRVVFKTLAGGTVQAGDRCILGLDVGSTTTKAVLLRTGDDALLASVYLRTGGDPVGAARKCYRAIADQIRQTVDPGSLHIEGLGVCGSGRQIAGLHALTPGVINEIIAHATAAVHFDPQVDTIFEIGGQDAKYTHITSGVPSDYAMNEACSAGTGSFLEESALETLGVPMEDIAAIALQGTRPPNFNDQCAAFIASDIKNAIHEGVDHEDIIAGLVYSICMNYANRVKGNRPVGEKVFMQGGVCYNRAVPLAMASLIGKPIVVPPEPGLMGAFGAALEIKKRIQNGLLPASAFDLDELAGREVAYKPPFVCKGGKERCDRRCQIAVIEIKGERYPFGGACNRYYNLRHNLRYDVAALDRVADRQRLVFRNASAGPAPSRNGGQRGTVGLNRSFLVNTYFPLLHAFFTTLGFQVVLPDRPSQEGIDQRSAAFCYPAELAHGFCHTLLTEHPALDFLLLPHFKAIPAANGTRNSQVCPLIQAEPYYLQATFRQHLGTLARQGTRVLSPLFNLTHGLAAAEGPLLSTAAQMGIGGRAARAAFQAALQAQIDCQAAMKALGDGMRAGIIADPESIGVVVFGRPYNAFAAEAHMGIPHKFASRGIPVMPLDFLPLEKEAAKHHMFWGMGQLILKAARYVVRHPQLFGVYITNFSCGPDSFLLGYFREIMGRKPSLTLELDNHTADAGLETRIEAFLDIVHAYRKLGKRPAPPMARPFQPARTVVENGEARVITSRGESLSFTDPRVTLLFPSMGKIASESLAAAFGSAGIRTRVHPPSDEAVLKIGRANTSCKECLPLILTTGTLLNYIHHHRRDGEVLIYFMPSTSGPCRFGQYHIFMQDLIQRLNLPDVALFSLTSENSYADLWSGMHRKGWWAVVVSDVFEDMRAMLLANASDAASALPVFEAEWEKVRGALQEGRWDGLEKQLGQTARRLRRIPLKRPPATVPTICLAGEIYVRRDAISRQYLTEMLAAQGFATTCAPIAEWVLYSDYLIDRGLAETRLNLAGRLKFLAQKIVMNYDETRLKEILSQSGLVHAAPIHIRSIVEAAKPYISPHLAGEAILTVGSTLSEIASHACGVIAIGPFGCMPNRIAEAILNETVNRETKLERFPRDKALPGILAGMKELPFLAIESDGSPFPQLIHAKLESFCLQATRLHQRMTAVRQASGNAH